MMVKNIASSVCSAAVFASVFGLGNVDAAGNMVGITVDGFDPAWASGEPTMSPCEKVNIEVYFDPTIGLSRFDPPVFLKFVIWADAPGDRHYYFTPTGWKEGSSFADPLTNAPDELKFDVAWPSVTSAASATLWDDSLPSGRYTINVSLQYSAQYRRTSSTGISGESVSTTLLPVQGSFTCKQ